jgi:hypothetical protein
MKHLLFLLSIVSFRSAYTQSPKDDAAAFSVGYENIIATDTGRIYKPGTGITDKFHYRPVEIDIWYPAIQGPPDRSIQYGELLDLLEKRSNRFQGDTVYRGLASELTQYLSINLKIDDTSRLTHLKTISYRDADPVRQRFPLILYMCAYNGMSYENLNLFESMASHGYVVASITSVGRYPGNMSTNPADLLEQVCDGAFALNSLKKKDDIDTDKIGLIGYSWGGSAALILAMNNTDIKAVLSLDGSEMHYYGESGEEDKDFDALRNLGSFQAKKVTIPYAYLESGSKQIGREVDSIYNILPSLPGQKYYVRFPKTAHEDFSCLPFLASQLSGEKGGAPTFYGQITQFSLNYFDQYVKGQSNTLSTQVAAIYRQHIGDSLYPVMHSVKKNELMVSGKVVDMVTRDALAYVNIGIPEKNTGTVTQHDGSFLINADAGLLLDSLRISMVGYQPRTYAISDFVNRSKPLVILLKRNITELTEAVVIAKHLPTKIKGNTTVSRFISIGLPLKFLGSETGIKIRVGKDPVLLKNFSFNISDNRLDTALFRMNIYNFKNGVPFENILQQNVLIPVGKQTGRYTINLTDYRIIVKGDLLISLEWIEGSSSGPQKGAIFLSAGFLNSATWHRLTSQGKWEKANGVGIGFNTMIQKLKN